jgi:hypothetical protein
VEVQSSRASARIRPTVFAARSRLGPYEIIGPLGAGGMARCIGRGTRGSTATSRSRCCRTVSRTIQIDAPGSRAKHGRSPRYPIRISLPSLTSQLAIALARRNESGLLAPRSAVSGRHLDDKISSGGGRQPKWRADGRELFFVTNDRKFYAVAVRASDGVEFSSPHYLFEMPSNTIGVRNSYVPSRDGQRFLINKVLDTTVSQSMWISIGGRR